MQKVCNITTLCATAAATLKILSGTTYPGLQRADSVSELCASAS
jgi:hypothetical protein